MENVYARLLGLSKSIQNPNYYEILGIEESCFHEASVESHYKIQLQKVQKLGNNPKYKETILFVKGELRKARTVLSNSKKRAEYDLVLLSQRTELLEKELELLTIKGYVAKKEEEYLIKRGRSLKIPNPRIEKILAPHKFNFLSRFSLDFVLLVSLLFWVFLSTYFYLENRELSKQITEAQEELIEKTIATKKKYAKPKKKLQKTTKTKSPKKNKVSLPKHKKIANMTYIPAGHFHMGNNKGNEDEAPERKIYLSAFYIGNYEVTNKEYRKFIVATNHVVPYSLRIEARAFNWDPIHRNYPQGKGDYPVVLVSWNDAMAYCHWLSKKWKRKVSLPTEAQWEKAARGYARSMYPWGNTPPNANDSFRANYAAGKRGDDDGYVFLAPAGSFPEGKSTFGVMDMAGNVYEWCLDSYDKFFYHKMSSYDPLNRPDNTWPWRVLRGGSWDHHPMFLKCTYRYSAQKDRYSIRWGFRFVVK